jgi:23S rRNA A1618 N6-methylase RlmF
MSTLKVGSIQPNSGTKVNITGSTLLITTASGHFSGSFEGDIRTTSISSSLSGSLIQGTSASFSVLDVGTGATCIYPILGHAEYNWKFVGTDIDKESLKSAEKIIRKNNLNDFISIRFQNEPLQIFKGVIKEYDSFSIAMCNPPFYKSEQEAYEATERKLKGLNRKDENFIRNFSGTSKELWYQGGEKAFLHNYLFESSLFKTQCLWFTTLVSKKDLVNGMHISLKKLGPSSVERTELNNIFVSDNGFSDISKSSKLISFSSISESSTNDPESSISSSEEISSSLIISG